MKSKVFLVLLFISVSSFGQKLNWIPFEWEGDTVSGKYIDKLSMNIPVTIDNLPHKFNMQFDLGAVTTNIYGKSISAYLDEYNGLKSKIDTTLTFWIQSQKNFMFKNVNFKLGDASFGQRNIGYFKDFGDAIPKDSIGTKTIKHIGTIGPDLFQGKYLIIDYPNQRICVTEQLPKRFAKAEFQPLVLKDGRIKIPLVINEKTEDLMFDTGSSLFALLTTEARASKISSDKIVDSLKISSWGEYFTVFGRNANTKIKFGQKELKPAVVFYDTVNKFDKFYEMENIWGLTGNAYFLNNVVIIDYKNQRFGVK